MRPFDPPFSLLLALRLLRSTRRDAFASFLSAVASGGIALGVAALTLALALLSGFQRALSDEVLARTPGIELTFPAAAGVEAPAAEAEVRAWLVGQPEVVVVQATQRGRGWLVSGARVQPVEVVGFEGELPSFFPAASERAPGLYLPDAWARAWGFALGEDLEVVAPRPTLGPLGPQPRSRRLPLVGTYATGRTDRSARIAVPLATAQALFGSGDRQLTVTTRDLGAALVLAPRLEAELGRRGLAATVRTWEQLNRPLLFALRLEKTMTFVAVSLITLVASLALVGGLALVIANKRVELGMLRAMGATAGMLRRAFLYLGAMLAGGGALVGGVGGVTTAVLLDRTAAVPLPGGAYFLDHVPFLVRPLDLLAVVMTTLGLALLCTSYGAQRAAALEPVAAMRR
jgi:lipoprotein-releasing system permease protein